MGKFKEFLKEDEITESNKIELDIDELKSIFRGAVDTSTKWGTGVGVVIKGGVTLDELLAFKKAAKVKNIEMMEFKDSIVVYVK